jgi:predicted nucleic acid-binding Zn ribbon protein
VGDRLDEPLRLRALLDPVGARLGVGAPADVGRLWAGWVDIVGQAVAGHAEPTSFRDGVLKVRADSPTWATEIGYLSETIRQASNRWLGKEAVREVRVWTSPAKVRVSPPAVTEDDRGQRRRGDREPERDPRKAFERARGAWAARRAQGRAGGRLRPGQSGKRPW